MLNRKKLRYKLYKSGKLWVTSATIMLCLLSGFVFNNHVKAATFVDNTNQSNNLTVLNTNKTIQNQQTTTYSSQKTVNESNNTFVNNTGQSDNNLPTPNTGKTVQNQQLNTYLGQKTDDESSNTVLSQEQSDSSSLWYHPSDDISSDEGDIERSGTGGGRNLWEEDQQQPGIIVYISFLHFSDNPEISQYAHKSVNRTIYLKDPRTGLESVGGHAQVNFNRWIAIDKNYNNQLVGAGPWILSLTSPSSFPEYYIPKISGYTSYCNGERTQRIEAENNISGNDPDENYYVTYVSDIKNITRTIIIKNPYNGLDNIVQNAEASGSDNIWPEYTIPQYDGYDSYVDGEKATSVPEQIANNSNITVNVTYQKETTTPNHSQHQQHKTITRTIDLYELNGHIDIVTQSVNYNRFVFKDENGDTSYSNWTVEGSSSWDEYIIPQHEGYKSQVNLHDAKIISSQYVSPNDSNVIIYVYYVKNNSSNNHSGWSYNDHNGWSYTDNNGNKLISQWRNINHNWYYFNNNGYAQKGWFQTQAGNWYYFDPTNAWALTGLQQINGHWYYFDPQNAWANKGWQQINGHWYYFDPTNTWAMTGWQLISGNWYYFDNQTAAAQTGWQQINGHWYYFDPTNAWADKGWFQTQAGNWYYFDPQNAWALTGWQQINGHWYYFDPTNAWADKGWFQTQAGNWYYFDPTNAWADTGWQWINGHWYYFDYANAWALKGWQLINGSWYYFDPTNTWMDTGWIQVGNKSYYLNASGAWTGQSN